MSKKQNTSLKNALNNHFHTFLAYDLKSEGHINPSPKSVDSKKLLKETANLTKVTMEVLQSGGFLKF